MINATSVATHDSASVACCGRPSPCHLTDRLSVKPNSGAAPDIGSGRPHLIGAETTAIPPNERPAIASGGIARPTAPRDRAGSPIVAGRAHVPLILRSRAAHRLDGLRRHRPRLGHTAAFAPLDLPARLLFDLLNWPFGEPLPALDRASRWSSAVGARLLIGFALLFLLVVAPEIERGNRRVVRGGVIALGGWFLVDSAGSIASGVASNVLWNVPFLLGWLLPRVLAGERGEGPVEGHAPVPTSG